MSPCPRGTCTATTSGDEVVGFLVVRHSIDSDFLRTRAGHVGYSIRPSRRRRGHAGRALGLALGRARGLGLARVLLTCDDDNTASARTIESQAAARGHQEGSSRRRRLTHA